MVLRLITELSRQNLKQIENCLDEMQRREKESEMITAKAPNNIRVVEYALAPTEPINQRRLAFLGLAFLASFSMGIGAALLRDYFGHSVRSPSEIAEPLSLPAMASISSIGGKRG